MRELAHILAPFLFLGVGALLWWRAEVEKRFDRSWRERQAYLDQQRRDMAARFKDIKS